MSTSNLPLSPPQQIQYHNYGEVNNALQPSIICFCISTSGHEDVCVSKYLQCLLEKLNLAIAVWEVVLARLFYFRGRMKWQLGVDHF